MGVRETILEPGAKEWAPSLRAWLGVRHDARAAVFRAELGLPADAPIVMTGHQTAFWHCGILAKYLACAAGAEALAARAAWLWVDQDEINPWRIAAPVTVAGRLTKRDFMLGPAPGEGVAAASAPAIRVGAPPTDAPQSVRSVFEAVSRRASESTAARQAAGALTDLMAPIVAPAPAIFATDLARTTLLRSLLTRMAEDPAPCARAYNEAVAMTPDAGLAPLRAQVARTELPLWRLRPGLPRERVFSDTALSIPADQLAPRAIFMTLLLRIAGCDLFLHGTGGGTYDIAAERWARSWLNEPLAPMAVVSATVTIDASLDAPPERAISHAAWRAHRARHDPAELGLADAAARKREAVRAIAAARAEGRDASAAYREMHRWLVEYRIANDAALRSLDAEANALAARREERALADSREWLFVCFDAPTLRDLRARVRAQFGLSA